MKRLALALAAAALAVVPFGTATAVAAPTTPTTTVTPATAAATVAADRVVFSPVSYQLTSNLNVAKVRFYSTFACYTDIKQHTFTYQGKVVVFLTGRHIPAGMMCIQALSELDVDVDMSRVNLKTGLLNFDLEPVRYNGYFDAK